MQTAAVSNDHFIAQTYLRHFVDASHRDMLHAYRKSDRLYFPCNTKDVCREWDGDKTPLLSNPALLGDFRKIFEPQWRSSVATLLTKEFDSADKFNISGYFANLMVCTPTWQRLARGMYNDSAKEFVFFRHAMQRKHGDEPGLPAAAIEKLKRGELELDHDPEFIKATIARQLLKFAWATYNQDWTLFQNDTEYPFITSDNPVAILQPLDPRLPVIRYLPVTPALCLCVVYNDMAVGPCNPQARPRGEVKWRRATSQGAKIINKLVAQCAEDLVFSSKKSPGIEALTRKYAAFGVYMDFVRFPGEGTDTEYHGPVLRVGRREREPKGY